MTVQISEAEISAETDVGTVQISEIAVERDVTSIGTIQISEIAVEVDDVLDVTTADFWGARGGRWRPRAGYSAAATPRRGNLATAAAATTPDYLVTSDSEATNIGDGDTVRLHHAGGALLDAATHTVISRESFAGFTNLHLSPVAGAAFVAGDYLQVIGVWS